MFCGRRGCPPAQIYKKKAVTKPVTAPCLDFTVCVRNCSGPGLLCAMRLRGGGTPSRRKPLPVTGYCASTFFSISSTCRRNALSVSIRFDTALHEWSTVAWLRPPMAAPMVVSGALVCCLARYMAICRAWAISRVRSVELKRAKSRFKYSHTTSMMWSSVISFW